MIKNKFLNLAANQKKAFIPYVVANFPNQDIFTETLYTLKDLGADLIEVGIPFSDPIAEGKIIESAHHQVLNDNFNLVSALEVIKNFKLDSDIPIVLMGYTNSFISPSLEAFIERAKKALVDGFLIVDLPYVEKDIYKTFHDNEIEFIQLIAPTTPLNEIESCISNNPAFIYFISQRGVTGSSNINKNEVLDNIQAIRDKTSLPVVLGFGLKDPSQINEFNSHADGFVIGSAIVELLNEDNPQAKLRQFLTPILTAIKNE